MTEKQLGKKAGKAPRNKGKKGMCHQDRPVLESKAAGIDVGAREMWVAVPPDLCGEPVRVFSTFTEDLELLVDWLISLGVRTVAMESTGVYWIPLYELLESRGIKACLVDARHMKNVPGRRTDWHDCQWLQYLHSVGLLRAAFRPEDQICAVRAIMRHRGELVGMAAQHVLHMQKALTQMNVQLHHVINDITGLTGLSIVDAILRGERDPEQLAKLRHYRIQANEATIRKSLAGNWRAEHLFTLKQSRELYRSYQEQIQGCDREIEALLVRVEARIDPREKPLPPDSKKSRKRNGRNGGADGDGFNMRMEMYKLYGVDVLQIPGLEGMAMSLFTEVGRDLTRFPTSGHFISWLGLCPDVDKSGKRRWTVARRIINRAGQLFRMAAYPLHRSLTPLGSYLRRMKSKLGPAGATMATARRIALIFYTMVKNQVEYDPGIWAKQDADREKRKEAKLRHQAKKLGFQLVPVTTIP